MQYFSELEGCLGSFMLKTVFSASCCISRVLDCLILEAHKETAFSLYSVTTVFVTWLTKVFAETVLMPKFELLNAHNCFNILFLITIS
jgi:hypothetical protein